MMHPIDITDCVEPPDGPRSFFFARISLELGEWQIHARSWTSKATEGRSWWGTCKSAEQCIEQAYEWRAQWRKGIAG